MTPGAAPRPPRQVAGHGKGRGALGAASLAAELRVALLRTSRRLRAEKSDVDLSDAQYGVLAVLDRQGAMTPRALAALERVQPPSMTRTLGGLLERGLVTRSEHPIDGRQVLVAVSDSGRAVVRETRL